MPEALADLRGITAYIENERLKEQAEADTIADIVKRIRQLLVTPK